MEDIIEYILEEKREGKENEEIEAELIAQGLSHEQAQEFIKKADSLYLDELIYGSEKKPLFQMDTRITAYALIALGLGVTTLTYTGIIDLGNVYIIFYGPVIAGVAMLGKNSRSRLKQMRNKFGSPYDKWRNR